MSFPSVHGAQSLGVKHAGARGDPQDPVVQPHRNGRVVRTVCSQVRDTGFSAPANHSCSAGACSWHKASSMRISPLPIVIHNDIDS
jgi:hypothetical protein